MSHQVERRIAIIGAGFCGTAAAIQLLRNRDGRRLEIILIERRSDFGRGVAYAKHDFHYLLNVPASRMAVTMDEPDAFLRFAQRRDPTVTGEDFLPRALFGDYLQELLDAAADDSGGGSRLRRLQGEAAFVSIGVKTPVEITLADGKRVHADTLVLATGAQIPRVPRGIRCDLAPPVLRPEPWAAGRSIAGRGPIVILGTGLTMIDVVCEAVARHRDVEIHAISRHGLVPPSQTAFRPDALADDGGLLAQCSGSVRRLVASVRDLAAEAERRGGDWREVITLVRRAIPNLWASLRVSERRRFLRHVRSYWDVHRHRLPGCLVTRIAQLRQSGQLVVHAGRALSLETAGAGARVKWQPRGSGQAAVLDAAEVVPCTGPEYDITRADEPLWKSLLDQGLVTPDELRLGVRTHEGALIGRDGSVSDRLFYLGPMLRADHWEATAVAELRAHAQALVRRLLGGAPAPLRRTGLR
jgi:uncharacterized NAD(P)/FAD-binding protein YdhS